MTGADFVILVSVLPIGGSTIAFAGSCPGPRSLASRRPLVGFLNVDPGRIEVTDLSLESTLRHEITHALGFSAQMIGEWRNKDTGLAHPVPVVRRTVNRRAQYDVNFLATPMVLEEVRRHFGCATLEGAEIENGGGSGTAGSHWEKTRFGLEYMVGSASGAGAVHSRLTLALLGDTGWYTPNMTSPYVAENPWGRGVGCGFALDSCTSESWTRLSLPYHCTNDELACGISHVSVNVCQVKDDEKGAVPVQFQYFADPSKLGSTDELSDYCPIVSPARDCSNSISQQTLLAHSQTHTHSSQEYFNRKRKRN